ncbi:Uncharacterised protein [Mycobacterium tuberculosis]|nr:Uncharacterised protein [Mycobacterium tuberculosis]CKV03385.1 Uncharacterised protein [Mycobacterium tuberculosis]CKV20330.1 Uncharacterised protein [Mycobacterium tuberculosis]
MTMVTRAKVFMMLFWLLEMIEAKVSVIECKTFP